MYLYKSINVFDTLKATYDLPCFYRHREPSGLALAMREAISHSWNENKVHSITHDKGGSFVTAPLATPASQ